LFITKAGKTAKYWNQEFQQQAEIDKKRIFSLESFKKAGIEHLKDEDQRAAEILATSYNAHLAGLSNRASDAILAETARREMDAVMQQAGAEDAGDEQPWKSTRKSLPNSLRAGRKLSCCPCNKSKSH
jgi:hypothetical protein